MMRYLGLARIFLFLVSDTYCFLFSIVYLLASKDCWCMSAMDGRDTKDLVNVVLMFLVKP